MTEPTEDAGKCVAAFGCKRYASVGFLCRGHFERLSTMLREIEDESALLCAVPSMQQRTGSGRSTLASERAPARLDVLVHTDRRRGTGRSETDDDALAAGDTLPILDVLHSWARVVREERNFATRDVITITGERDVLSRQLEWVAGQPWVDECFRDVWHLLSQLRAANGHLADRPYSNCPAIIGGDYCIGNVWIRDEIQAVWRRYVDRCAQTWEQAPGAAVCDTCGSTWITEAEKARLRRMVEAAATELGRPRTSDGRPMMTAEEVAENLGKTVNAVRIMATRAGVKAEAGHYDPQVFGLASHVA